MKFIKNIKWLLTQAPTSITQSVDDISCDYCGAINNLTNYQNSGCVICQNCKKKVFDSILKTRKESK